MLLSIYVAVQTRDWCTRVYTNLAFALQHLLKTVIYYIDLLSEIIILLLPQPIIIFPTSFFLYYFLI